jgi:hypothetical protein
VEVGVAGEHGPPEERHGVLVPGSGGSSGVVFELGKRVGLVWVMKDPVAQ